MEKRSRQGQRPIRLSRGVTFFLALLALFAVILLIAPDPFSVAEAQGASGSVTVTGTNNAKITIVITDSTAVFGTSLAPDGTGTGGEIISEVSPNTTTTEGAYYIWSPTSAPGPTVIVRSNKTWNSTIEASENAGTATSMTISSGVLRYDTSVPGTYAAAAAATPFTTPAAAWETNHAKGATLYTFYYFLRVDWTDDPGTFSSGVTYSVSQ